MSSSVADLESALQGMLQLKPPGVSGSRILSITALCNSNVQSESVLIQKLYTHFKKTPSTHKLGVLYVVDSVTRKWTEQAKVSGQTINSAAEDGTYAAGVNRVTELLPVLMNDIAQSAPENQKEKITKLVDIWEKGSTFPLPLLASFKEKLAATSQPISTTPPGSPPTDLRSSIGLAQPAPAAATMPTSSASSILAALTNMARQNTSAAPPAPVNQVQDSPFQVPNGHNNPAQQAPNLLSSTYPAPVNVPAPAAFAPQAQAPTQAAPGLYSNAYPSLGPQPIMPPAIDPATFQQQLMMINMLKSQGIADEQIPGIIGMMMAAQGAAGTGLPPVLPPPFPPVQNQNQIQNAQNGQNGQSLWGARQEESRDRDRKGPESMRSPDRYGRRRSRSRSPPGWNPRESPNTRRDGPKFKTETDSPDRKWGGEERGRPGRGDEYRQRSPPRRRRSPTPPRYGGPEKWIGHDNTIKGNDIKVLSRTLFVGGVNCSEQELRNTFELFGRVQTCIVNKDKRHAFVKMISRKDAVASKEAMEKNRAPDSQLRTRWGVGFGPRDCSDYQTGVSIIPISKLTDADRKWMLTAEYGGSGGKPIEAGMVVEEPDIEIGQGVSSKAISRRMQTDKGGNNGPKSGRDRDDDDRPSRFRRGSDEERRDRRRDDDRGRRSYSKNEIKTENPPAPAVPAFGLGVPGFKFATLPNGQPMVPPPPGYPGFLAQTQNQQPPPPGHRT